MAERKRSDKGEMSQGQRGEKSVMRDAYYDLVSVEYHALQGMETSGKYLEDAKEEGNKELTQYFEKTQQQYRQIADEGKKLLSKHGELK